MVKDPISGELFKSVEEMCKEHNIGTSTYFGRLKLGWTQEQALTTPVKIVTDHLGKKFKSIKEMCRQYNISTITYYARLKLGWTQEQALTTPVSTKERVTIIEDSSEKGLKYVKEMCKEYNISIKTYYYRLAHGWTQEQALITPAKKIAKGVKFLNILEKVSVLGKK